MAGYSGTSLLRKLGMKDGHRIALAGAPQGFEETLGDLSSMTVARSLAGKGTFDVIVFFTKSRSELAVHFAALPKRLDPGGGLWTAWPKKASKVKTDVTEDVVRDIALEVGLVDNKVCAIDDTWSGLRCVYRKAFRGRRRASRTARSTVRADGSHAMEARPLPGLPGRAS